MKKFFASILSLVLVFTTVTPVFAATPAKPNAQESSHATISMLVDSIEPLSDRFTYRYETSASRLVTSTTITHE